MLPAFRKLHTGYDSGLATLKMNEISLDNLTRWNNLFLAWQKASKGKRGKAEVALFEYQLEDNLLLLQEKLRTGQWRPAGYHSFYIHDPKRRLISAAPFADRVVHHALCNLTEPLFERSFVADSFANRIGKGNHRALDKAQYYAKRFRYVLSVDVRKFFPSIDHAILFRLLSRKIVDENLRQLVAQIIESGQGVLGEETNNEGFPEDDLIDLMRPKGLPIGNLTSQLWANVYLNPLDHYIKRSLRCQAYVRYVDDMLLFSNEKKVLWEWLNKVQIYLYTLRLHLHRGAHPRPITEGVGFLGFRVFPYRRRLKRRKGIQYQRHLHQLLADYQQGLIEMDNVLDSVMAWNNHVSYGNTIGLRKQLFSILPDEIAVEARVKYQRIVERRKKHNNVGWC